MSDPENIASAKDAQPSVKDRKKALRPVSESVWYALATVAGETANHDQNLDERATWDLNARYWNEFLTALSRDRREYSWSHKKETANLFGGTASTRFLENIAKHLEKKGFGELVHNGKIYYKDKAFDKIDFSSFAFTLPLVFKGCTFPRNTTFHSSDFEEGLTFDACDFLGEANFDNIDCYGELTFKESQFNASAYFNESRFFKEVSFTRVQFHSTCRIVGCDFSDHCTMKNCSFEGAFAIYKTKFRERIFLNRCNLKGSLQLAAVDFVNTPLQIFDTPLPELTFFSLVNWPTKHKMTRSQIHISAYERLGQIMKKQERHHDRHIFHSLEMRARRIADRNILSKSVSWFYDIICDYGYGFGRASAWWGGHIALGMFALEPWKDTQLGYPTCSNIWTAITHWGSALITSFSNAHAFLVLNRGPLKSLYSDYAAKDLLISFNFTWGFQAIVGFALVFFLGLTIRNRFRLG